MAVAYWFVSLFPCYSPTIRSPLHHKEIGDTQKRQPEVSIGTHNVTTLENLAVVRIGLAAVSPQPPTDLPMSSDDLVLLQVLLLCHMLILGTMPPKSHAVALLREPGRAES